MITLLPKVRENGYERKERLEVNMAREAKMVTCREAGRRKTDIRADGEPIFFGDATVGTLDDDSG
jgi:hypothetical protein